MNVNPDLRVVAHTVVRERIRIACCAALVAACARTSERTAEGVHPSEEECDTLYESLSDEHQRAVQDWAAAVEAARGTDRFEALREQRAEITRCFLPRFQELAGRECGCAKLAVLDLLGHIEPHQEARVDYAIGLLEDLVHEHAGAWWISDLGDNDVLRYFLLSSRRQRAIELLDGFAQRTTDEEACRRVLFELGFGRIWNPGEGDDRQAALRTLDGVIERWPESQEAEIARGLLRSERELQVGESMPLLEGPDVDGRPQSLEALRGKVVVVDFFGFWCGPCREGIPVLQHLVARHSDEQFTVLGVDAHDDEETFRRERDKLGVSWPCVFDGVEASRSKALGISVFPAVFVVDRKGVIRARNPAEDELERIVDELICGR